MAPRKKEEKASANEAADMVLHYLRKQNRPYSALEVSANLHNKVTKAAAAKVLKDLHEQKAIEGRPAGKQIVYHAIQDPSASCTTEQLAALDTHITDLRNQATHLLATSKILRSTLSSLNSELSTTDLFANVAALESEKAEIMARLESLKLGKAQKVTIEQREEVEREWKKCGRTARMREMVARECWRFVEDQVQDQERAAELRESLGLDD
ncbi:homologous-pairing protein-like protein 2 [Setomelanomma holmii]|uniref:Homologous-pairing protein-like protein 2 n=1 Tax=Setomelanomma holmii TaxID=210430 RepID=A0A9P4LS34_9PLEO|nr:homologous-pairing protein-like protein 2 [Setomelanomma holmii]